MNKQEIVFDSFRYDEHSRRYHITLNFSITTKFVANQFHYIVENDRPLKRKETISFCLPGYSKKKMVQFHQSFSGEYEQLFLNMIAFLEEFEETKKYEVALLSKAENSISTYFLFQFNNFPPIELSFFHHKGRTIDQYLQFSRTTFHHPKVKDILHYLFHKSNYRITLMKYRF